MRLAVVALTGVFELGDKVMPIKNHDASLSECPFAG
jgi:hypothetical protein